ncbi:hypothetical protein PTSG_06423, partial [Salpingoeca rosetta]
MVVMEAGSHAGCCGCNSPDSAAVAVLMQCSHMGWLPEDRWRMMGGCTHDGLGGAAVDTHVHGHGGHIQPQRRSYAQLSCHHHHPHHRHRPHSRHHTPADANPDLAVEEVHEAVEPTTMTMTMMKRASKGHGVARGRLFSPFPPPAAATTADVWLHLDERALCILSISSSSSPSLVPNSSGCGHRCGGCIVRRCAVASHDDDDDGGEWTVTDLFPSPHDTSRAIHAHTNVREKKTQAFPPCDVQLLRRDRDSGQH